MQYGFDWLGAIVSLFMPMAFYWPVTCKNYDFPEIVIVMNLFEGPKFVSIISSLGGPEI